MPFLSVFFVFYRNHIVLLSLISRCMTSISEYFLNNKDIVDLCIVNFYVRKLFIQCNTGSRCAHITGGVNTYLYMCLSILVLVCPACVCQCLWY